MEGMRDKVRERAPDDCATADDGLVGVVKELLMDKAVRDTPDGRDESADLTDTIDTGDVDFADESARLLAGELADKLARDADEEIADNIPEDATETVKTWELGFTENGVDTVNPEETFEELPTVPEDNERCEAAMEEATDT